jgi:hypothetical protein
MSEYITFTSRKITPKGLSDNTPLNQEKIKSYFYSTEYEKLKLLDGFTIPLEAQNPTLLYPGCGTDILTPLLYIEKIFSNTKKWDLIFVDTSNTFDILKTILDDVGVFFEETKNNEIRFYWSDILISLQFFEQDIFSSIDSFDFDIYFERAFRIMKDQVPEYEYLVYAQLRNNGVIISDNGFARQKLERISVPLTLSSYGEMIIGVKK